MVLGAAASIAVGQEAAALPMVVSSDASLVWQEENVSMV